MTDDGKMNAHAKWLRSNRERLLETAVPVGLFENERAWCIFLEDGQFDPTEAVPFSCDVDAMSEDEAVKLCDLLVELYPERLDDGTSMYRALNRLEYLLLRGPHA